MWPAADVERIRTAVLDARTHGIRAEVDGVSAGGPNGKKKRVALFDATSRSGPGKSEIISPRPIQLRRPPLIGPAQSLGEAELLLDLVIDSAGKVRSAESSGKPKWPDPDLLRAT